MMKRVLAIILALCMLCAAMPAMAAVRATPNQSLAFRTGPNTKYAELYTLPKSTSIQAIEYEEGNGVTWVLVEFTYQGERVRAYTGLKRMSVNGSIPWANHEYSSAYTTSSGTVYAAPYGAYRSSISDGASVTILDYEGDYIFIEYYDSRAGALSRGYIPDWMITYGDGYDYSDDYEYDYDYYGGTAYDWDGVPAVAIDQLAFRTGPNTKYVELYTLPKSTNITAYSYAEGNGVTWVMVEFFYNGQRVRGYTGLKRMNVYGDIPWEDDLGYCNITSAGSVYAAPSSDAAYRGKVGNGERCKLLGYENGYAFIEFYDASNKASSRGYVEQWRTN